jgi:DNA-binding transcriptional ArsR family regulator
MQWEQAAQGFAAMGSEARLRVLRVLIRAGHDGLSVQEIGARTGVPPSTLAHHLKFLTGAGLLTQTREGRTQRTRADYDALRGLADFILQECCADTSSRRAANDG